MAYRSADEFPGATPSYPRRVSVRWKLPLTKDLRTTLGKQAGDEVTVHLEERLA